LTSSLRIINSASAMTLMRFELWRIRSRVSRAFCSASSCCARLADQYSRSYFLISRHAASSCFDASAFILSRILRTYSSGTSPRPPSSTPLVAFTWAHMPFTCCSWPGVKGVLLTPYMSTHGVRLGGWGVHRRREPCTPSKTPRVSSLSPNATPGEMILKPTECGTVWAPRGAPEAVTVPGVPC
jgi:hypothetical protein